MLVAVVRHSSMPRPQVADHDVATERLGLERRPDRPPGLLCLLRDPGDVRVRLVQLVREQPTLAGSLLVLDGRLRVGPEPELGRAVLHCEVAEGNVGDEVVGALGVVEGRVLVLGLAHARRVGHRRVGREPVPDGLGAQIPFFLFSLHVRHPST